MRQDLCFPALATSDTHSPYPLTIFIVLAATMKLLKLPVPIPFALITLSNLCLARFLPGTNQFINLTLKPNRGALNLNLSTQAPPTWNLPKLATDEVWETLVCKGRKLMEAFRYSDSLAGLLLTPPRDSVKSRFQDFPREFGEWDYTFLDLEEETEGGSPLGEHYGVEEALKALTVDWKTKKNGGHNELVGFSHGGMFTPLG
jgi:hypothetical protein